MLNCFNQVRPNAIEYSRDWAGVKNKRAEKRTLWTSFSRIAALNAASRRALKKSRCARKEERATHDYQTYIEEF